MSRLVIRNVDAITLDADLGFIADCDLLIDGGRLVEVGPDLGPVDAEVIDGRHCVAIPGFVDTHRHLWQTVIRGSLPSCTIADYFVKVMLGYGRSFRAEDVYAGNLAGAWEALNAGVTTIVDWCNCTNTPEHADAAVRALTESGIRAMYGYGPPAGAPRGEGHPQDARRVRSQYFSAEGGLLTFALALRGPNATEPEVNRGDFRLARELDARVTMHAGIRVPGTRWDEVEVLAQDRLLNDAITFVHCNRTPDAHLRLIAETGATISASPFIEMLMGQGVPVTRRALANGLRPTLSVDVTTSAPGDMFTQMRTALAQHRAADLPDDDQTPFEPTLSAEDILRFATIDGARACGLQDRIGSLSPGKAADVVLLRVDDINTLGAIDPVGAVVTCADTSNVDTVIVEGRVIKRDGILVDVDISGLRATVEAAQGRLLSNTA